MHAPPTHTTWAAPNDVKVLRPVLVQSSVQRESWRVLDGMWQSSGAVEVEARSLTGLFSCVHSWKHLWTTSLQFLFLQSWLLRGPRTAIHNRAFSCDVITFEITKENRKVLASSRVKVALCHTSHCHKWHRILPDFGPGSSWARRATQRCLSLFKA